MNKIILFLTVCLVFSCKKNPNINITEEPGENEVARNEIVLIFKNKNKNNDSLVKVTSKLKKENLYYTEKGTYIVNELIPNKTVESDTMIIPVTSDRISLSHKYNSVENYIFEFQNGDTVIFDYSRGYPYASIQNRKTLKYDNNFLSDLRMEKPLDIFEFVKKNSRLRSARESEIYLLELSNYTKNLNKNLDSIFNKGLISESNYNMFKGYSVFFEINTNPNLLKNIDENDLKRDDLLYIKSYRHFLNNYVVKKFGLKTKYIDNPMSCDSKIGYDSIQNSSIFSKKVKESLLYAHLNNIGNKDSDQNFKKYFDKFQREVKDTVIINKIKDNFLIDFNALKTDSKKVHLTDINKKSQTLSSLILKNKGKVIYIDLWASWCAPCLKQMPFSDILKKEYKNKGITFIYLSIDKDFEKWASTASEKKILENSFLAINYPNANYFKELKISTIPRYLIYDKTGKLVHKNAPEPESDEIKKMFDKYLVQ